MLRRLSWPLIIFIVTLPLTAQAPPPPVQATAQVLLNVQPYAYVGCIGCFTVRTNNQGNGTGHSPYFSCGANYSATLTVTQIWHPGPPNQGVWTGWVVPASINQQQINNARAYVSVTGGKRNHTYNGVSVTVTLSPPG